MALSVTPEDYRFILLSTRFCHNIDKYIFLLGLDAGTVKAYQDMHKELVHAFNNASRYSSCVESFIKTQSNEMRLDFYTLLCMCWTSGRYSRQIGQDLGIEDEVLVESGN